MADNVPEIIEIYLDGTVISYDARDGVSIQMQEEFLNRLTGYFDHSGRKKNLFYILTKEQWILFTNFRLGKQQ
jgi:hypothetical protein